MIIGREYTRAKTSKDGMLETSQILGMLLSKRFDAKIQVDFGDP